MEDLKELRKTAEAATPGPWTRDGVGVLGAREDWDGGKGPARIMKAMMPWRTERMEANAEHVATFNPETVLALLSRVEKAERSCRLLGTIIERDGKNLVELTNSQDIIPEDGDGDWEVVWERAQEMKVRLERAEQAVARVRELHSTGFYDKWGRDSSEPVGHGGWCSICGRFDGDACRTIRALDGDGR